MKLSTQVWGLITFVVCAAVIAAGWFLGASPLLTAQALAEQQRKDAVVQNDAILAKIQQLEAQKAKLDTYERRNSELSAMIPSDIEAADFIRSLNDLATATNVQLSAIAFSDPVPYAAPSGEAQDEGAPLPVTDSRINGGNFLLIPVSLEVSGGWNEVLAFTHGVQTGSRLVLVTTVNTADNVGTYTTKLSGAMYVLIRPGAPVAAPGTVGADPDASAGG